MKPDLKSLTEQTLVLAEQAGDILLHFWRHPAKLTIQKKADHSPCTAADLSAHQLLFEGLGKLSPALPVLSEEGENITWEQRRQWTAYWLIDPLDGTRGFIAGIEEFSVNIALIFENRPVLGILYSPVSKTVYYAWLGGGAFKKTSDKTVHKIHTAPKEEKNAWRILLGKYSRGKRLQQYIQDQLPYAFIHVNSAIKFGWLAEGQSDLYVRLTPINEWDTAAGQCILTEAGGTVVDLKGKPLQYNRQASLLTPEFIALADLRWLDAWLNIFVKGGNKT